MAEESLGASVQPLGSAVFFGPVQPEMLDRIHELEAASYPEDEAATYDKLKFRIENASNVFLVALSAEGDGEPKVVGFVCGTQTRASKLTHESMSTHDADGALLCIHSGEQRPWAVGALSLWVARAQARRRGAGARQRPLHPPAPPAAVNRPPPHLSASSSCFAHVCVCVCMRSGGGRRAAPARPGHPHAPSLHRLCGRYLPGPDRDTAADQAEPGKEEGRGMAAQR